MRLWGWPVALALLSAAGLFCGLWGDGGWDWAGWVGLGGPTAVALWFGWRGRGPRGD